MDRKYQLSWKIYRNILWVILLLPGLLAACDSNDGAQVVNQPTPTPLPTPVVPEKPTYTVESGTVIRTLEFTGRVSPVLEQELFFKTDGFVDQLFVVRGDEVEAGDVLAQLEISDLEGQLAQAEVAVQTAELKLEQEEQRIEDELVQAEIELAKLELQLQQKETNTNSAQIVDAQVGLESAQRALDEAQDAYDTAFDPGREWEFGIPHMKEALENERDAAIKNLQNAEDNVTVARAKYNDAFASSSTDAIEEQILEKDLELSQLKIEQLERGVDPLLALDVEKARLDIADIERKIADAQLIAPFAGEVLSIGSRPGDRVEAFSTVIVLADPSELEITADLGSEDLSEMSIGQTAVIQLRNRPENEFDGTVRLLPYPYGGGAVSAEDNNEVARIAFVNAPALELGELANVTIVLEERTDTLWLPPAALRSFQGRDFVVVQLDDGQQRVDVRLGITSETRVEVLEGVAEGQVIVGE